MFERAYIGAARGIVWAGHDGDDDNERDGLVDKELGDFEDKIKWEEGDWTQVCGWVKAPKIDVREVQQGVR